MSEAESAALDAWIEAVQRDQGNDVADDESEE